MSIRRLTIAPSVLAGLLFGTSVMAAQPNHSRVSPDGVWTLLDEHPADRAGAVPAVRPPLAQALRLDPVAMARQLEDAPAEFSPQAISMPLIMALPMPDGTFSRFSVVETGVMPPELAAQFPFIKTYTGHGIDDPAASIRLDTTQHGFGAMVLAPSGTVLIDPWTKGDPVAYSSFYKRNVPANPNGWSCSAEADRAGDPFLRRLSDRYAHDTGSGGERAVTGLRNYRIAVATTGEYTQIYGGTVADGMSGVVAAINRINGIFERDHGIRFTLVGNNSSIIYTSASDPYNNTVGLTLLNQNQSNLDNVIGSGNYDIGHVFCTEGGGLALVAGACVAGGKAKGASAFLFPQDMFWVGYVSHEIGHQFGAHHTYNSSAAFCASQRSAEHAFEPGSGSTTMAYPGHCPGDDVEYTHDDYFHSQSIAEIAAHVSGPGSCRPSVPNGNNTPIISVMSPTGVTIPARTPYQLTAAGSDPEGSSVTYCWEQRDLGPAVSISAGDTGTGPINRSYPPTTSGVRYVPTLPTALSGGTGNPGDILPTTTRSMNWRVTARDNAAGGGGTAIANYAFNVFDTGAAFAITTRRPPNWTVSGFAPITWAVAGTTANGINCPNVRILLSTNGGVSFPTVLMASTPNDGSESVPLPALPFTVTSCRLKIEGINNIFFAVDISDFTIVPPGAPSPFSLLTPTDGATGVPLPVTLTWATSSGATSYSVLVDTDSAFALPNTYAATTGATSASVPSGALMPGVTYYWRVTASNSMSTIGNPNPSVFTTANPPPCLGDLNNDHAVNTADLTMFLGAFGQSVPPGTMGDFDNSGTVNTADLTVFLGRFGQPCP